MFGHKSIEKMRAHGDVAGLLTSFVAAVMKDDEAHDRHAEEESRVADAQARAAGEALVELGKPGIDALISLFTHEKSLVGARACNLVGAATNPYALTVLLALAHDADERLRGWAVLALGDRSEPEAVEALGQALEDPEAYIRGRAAEALAARGDHRAVPELIRMLTDEGHNVFTHERIKMLAELKDPRAVPVFDALLRRPPRTSFDLTHTFALEGLEAIGGPEADHARAILGPAHDLDMLRMNLADLPLYYGRPAMSVLGGGAQMAAEQIPIICSNLEDAAKALRTGVDPQGEAIEPWQVRRGLEALLADVSGPAVAGLMATQLTPDGVQTFENMLARLEEITGSMPAA